MKTDSIQNIAGLAAPLPITSEGKIGAIIFTSFGLPIHLIFIIHLGRTISVRLQLFAKVMENKVADLRERIDNGKLPVLYHFKITMIVTLFTMKIRF